MLIRRTATRLPRRPGVLLAATALVVGSGAGERGSEFTRPGWMAAEVAAAEPGCEAARMTGFEKIAAHVPPGTILPPELRAICDELDRVGYPISGDMEIRPDDFGGLVAWFGGDEEMASQFAPFGAGADGSILAFWLRGARDARQAPIVHLGSEGDHCLVLARDFREFLRLFAIGHSELGFDDLSEPPADPESASWLRTMVREQYHLEVPDTGAEIVREAQAATPSVEAVIEEWFQRRYGPTS